MSADPVSPLKATALRLRDLLASVTVAPSPDPVPCSGCSGSGSIWYAAGGSWPCPRCQGDGRLAVTPPDPVAALQRARPLLDDLIDLIDDAERYAAYLRRARPHDLRGVPGGQVTTRPEMGSDVAERWEC